MIKIAKFRLDSVSEKGSVVERSVAQTKVLGVTILPAIVLLGRHLSDVSNQERVTYLIYLHQVTPHEMVL